MSLYYAFQYCWICRIKCSIYDRCTLSLFFFYFLWPFSQNLAITICKFSDNIEIIWILALIAIWRSLSTSILQFSARIHRIKGLIRNVTNTYRIQLHGVRKDSQISRNLEFGVLLQCRPNSLLYRFISFISVILSLLFLCHKHDCKLIW